MERIINEKIVSSVLETLKGFQNKEEADHDTVAFFHVKDTPHGEDADHNVLFFFNGCDDHAFPMIISAMVNARPEILEIIFREILKLKISRTRAEHEKQQKAQKN